MKRLLVFLAVTALGCDASIYSSRPSDKTFLDWIDGERVAVTRFAGIDWQTVTIDKDAVVDFGIERVSEAPTGVYAARVRFHLMSEGRVISVKGVVRYHRDDEQPGQLIYSAFAVTDVAKR